MASENLKIYRGSRIGDDVTREWNTFAMPALAQRPGFTHAAAEPVRPGPPAASLG